MKYINRETREGRKRTVARAVSNRLAVKLKRAYEAHDNSNSYLIEEQEYTG